MTKTARKTQLKARYMYSIADAEGAVWLGL